MGRGVWRAFRLQAAIKRMQTIGPLGREVQDLTGIRWVGKDRPRLARQAAGTGTSLPLVFLAVVVGALMGGTAALFALVAGLIPTSIVALFEQLADMAGMGY